MSKKKHRGKECIYLYIDQLKMTPNTTNNIDNPSDTALERSEARHMLVGV